MAGTPPDIVCRPVTGKDDAIITQLFGPKGACAGCWCMHWRLEKGGTTWTDNQGERGVATALLAMAIETAFARRRGSGSVPDAAAGGRKSCRRLRLDRHTGADREDRLQAQPAQYAGVGQETPAPAVTDD